jgi:DNA-binding NarL/FixJ family response regulator
VSPSPPLFVKSSPLELRENASICVLHVDEHRLISLGLVYFMASKPEFQFDYAQNPAMALKVMQRKVPEILITEVTFEEADGLQWIAEVAKAFPTVKIVALTTLDPRIYGVRTLRAGAHGYVGKGNDPTLIVNSLHQVLRNEVSIPDHELPMLIHGSLRDTQLNWEDLSNRELLVFRLLGQAYSTIQIAKRLSRSAKTIEAHRQRIMTKLGIKRANQLVNEATKWVFSFHGPRHLPRPKKKLTKGPHRPDAQTRHGLNKPSVRAAK